MTPCNDRTQYRAEFTDVARGPWLELTSRPTSATAGTSARATGWPTASTAA